MPLIPEEETLSVLISSALSAYQEFDERTQQARGGKIGPSDIGFCRQKATYVLSGVQPTDSRSMWSAAVGTAVHDYTKQALKRQFPAWKCDDTKVTAFFPNLNAKISGTPDMIVPAYNLILDAKTVDGFEKIRRYGVPLSHRMQRHIYAIGAVQDGHLDGTSQVYVGNVYFDRSGKESKPLVLIEEFDDAFTGEVEDWISDVLYAATNSEDASRDIAPAVCERICEFFSVCRGSLPAHDSEPITHPDLIQAIDMYVEGRDMEKQGKALKTKASIDLKGINGSDGRFQVRWVETAPVDVPGYQRAASMRLDVRPVKRNSK